MAMINRGLTSEGAKKLARILRQKRVSMKMTQRTFAEHLGKIKMGVLGVKPENRHEWVLSHGSIQLWEDPSKEAVPDMNNLCVLAELFGMDIQMFIQFLNSPYEDIKKFLEEGSDGKKIKEELLNPTIVASVLDELDSETRLKIGQRFIEDMITKVAGGNKVTLEQVKQFFQEADRSIKVEFYKFLQEELI